MLAYVNSLSTWGLIQYASNAVYVLLAVWGLIHFNPRRVRHNMSEGPCWLLLAMWLGFMGGAIHSTAWVLVGPPLEFYGHISSSGVEWLGGIIGDIIGKGLVGVSVYLHFYARWASLPEEERPFWSPLLMGFYPDTDKLFYKTVRNLTFGLVVKK